MTLRQLEVIPKELLVQFEEIPYLVRPQVEYLGREPREMPVLANEDALYQLYTSNINPIVFALNAGRKDGYSSLSERQPLVTAGKLSKDAMVGILSNFHNEVKKFSISVELGPDWQPEKRMPMGKTWLGGTKRYKLPKGMNAVMYRNWSLSGDNIDVSKADVIPINWIETSGGPNREMVQFGIYPFAFVFADKWKAINNFDGLNSLSLNFKERTRPTANTWFGSRHSTPEKGALLYSRQGAEEMVQNFDPSKVKVINKI